LVEDVMVDYHKKKNISPETKSRMISTVTPSTKGSMCIILVGIAEGGIAGCGISLQYHPLLWWVGLRKVREKYHSYIYQ
jgi:hypothetical protein